MHRPLGDECANVQFNLHIFYVSILSLPRTFLLFASTFKGNNKLNIDIDQWTALAAHSGALGMKGVCVLNDCKERAEVKRHIHKRDYFSRFFNINFRLFLTTVPVAYTAVCN